MTVFIEGPALPLDIKNVNGWGVQTPDAGAAISSLKSSVIRVCSRDSPHGCDISEDPNREIGHIVDAWQQNGVVMTKAAITDTVAKQKIQDGTWGNKWSVYAPNYDSLNDGWAKGINIKSLTLVQNPAWADAHYDLSASADGKYELRNVSEFTIIASETQEGEIITKELEDNKTNIETPLAAATKTCVEQLAEMTLLMDGMKKKSSMQASTIEELTASKATLEKEIGDKTTLIASLETKAAGSMTIEQAEKWFDTKMTQVKEADNLSAARDRFIAARQGIGEEDTNMDEYSALTASALDKITGNLTRKLSVSEPGSGPAPKYPDTPVGGTVGNCNAGPGEWKV